MAQYLPRAWTEASTSAKEVLARQQTAEAHAVQARVDMSENVVGAGLCPVCKTPMTGGFQANGHAVQVCLRDRIALPIPDQVTGL